MGISSINLAMGASSYGAYNQKLTAATKAKLDESGIIYNSNITEQEGKALLLKAESIKNSQNNQNLNFSNKNQSKDSLFERAKELAEKLGINIDEKTEFNKLIKLIETTLENKINSNQSNTEMLKKLNEYSQELANIQAESTGSSGFNSTNLALEKSLEMLSLYNKNFIHN